MTSRSKDLRSAVIRLAHENPELRGDLLPLVVASSDPSQDLLSALKASTDTRTAEGLARQVRAPRIVVERLLRKMEKAGLVKSEVPGAYSLRVWSAV